MSGQRLFEQLLRLHRGGAPLEDFLTELACAAMQHDSALTRRWLSGVGIAVASDAMISVESQVKVAGLADHDTDSRIDIVLVISAPDATDIVFIESKVWAGEGHDQLKRYAELLADRKNVRSRHLVYLTAEYDPKDDPRVEGVRFHAARWHDLHRLLSGSKQNPLTTEIARFMETKGLSQGDRFSPTDIVTLRNLRRLSNLMEAVLRGEVSSRMQKITRRTYVDTSLFRLMREQGAWTLEGRWDEAQSGLVAGFVQPDNDDPSAYPLAVVLIWVAPKAPSHEAIRRSMRTTCAAGVWRAQSLDCPGEYFGMRLQMSLDSVLGEKNHVKPLQRFLLDGLDKAADWIEKNPCIVGKDTSSAVAGSRVSAEPTATG